MDEERSGRVLQVEKPGSEMTFGAWRSIIEFNFPELVFAAEIALSILGQLLINDITNPFALVLVDVPSSGKTITINFFAEIEGLTYASDKFTPASFISNAANVPKEKLKEFDLLPRLKYKMLLLRDLATLFSKRDDDLNESLGLLTRVLDGEGLNTDSGIHGKRQYVGEYLFMILAGSTPIPPRVWKIMGNLGSRLFFLRLNTKEKSEDELADQVTTHSHKVKELACKEITKAYLYSLWSNNPEGVEWNKEQDPAELKRIIARCAKLLARLRGVINVWKADDDKDYIHSIPTVEKPDRINQLFYNLARGHALISGRRQITEEDLKPIIELAIDSAPIVRAKLLRKLLDYNGTMKTGDVMKELECSRPTAHKEMETLKALGVCTINDEDLDDFGTVEKQIFLSKELSWFLSDECKQLRANP